MRIIENDIVSIIVPVYNSEVYLPTCIESILKQTVDNWELILVDDGSLDSSGSICDQYALKDSRIRVLHVKNGGVCSARNQGVDAATGSFLFFCDSDDWLEQDACEKLLTVQRKKDADIVYADIFSERDDRQTYTKVFANEFDTDDIEYIKGLRRVCIGYGYSPSPKKKLSVSGYGSVGNKLLKTSIVRENGIRFDDYTLGVYEDNLFTMSYLEYVKRAAYIAQPVYHYRQIETSSIHRFRQESLIISDRIFECVLRLIAEETDADFTLAFYILVIRRLSEELRVFYFHKDNPKTAREMRVLLKTRLHAEPYSSAIRNVNPSRLMTAHKYTWMSARSFSSYIMWLTYLLREKLKQLL